MNTRITFDLKDPLYLRHLKLIAAEKHKTLREIIMESLDNYLGSYLENRAILKLAEKTFEEWNNPEDSAYDHL